MHAWEQVLPYSGKFSWDPVFMVGHYSCFVSSNSIQEKQFPYTIATPLAYYVNVTDMPHWHHEINNYCWYVLNMHVSKTAPLLQLHVLLCLWFVCMVQSILHVAAAVSTPVYIAHMLATTMPPCTNFQCILAIVM